MAASDTEDRTRANRRADEMFPRLSDAELDQVSGFGQPVRFSPGDFIVETGKAGVGLLFVLAGEVRVSQHDGFGHSADVARHGRGEFIGEISSLSGRPALVDVVAQGAVEAIALTPADLRALIVADAGLGERLMRALILRRTSLIETAAGGPLLIAPAGHPGVARIGNFLRRNGFPFRAVTPGEQADIADLVAHTVQGDADFPLVLMPNGGTLRDPDEDSLAAALGMVGGLSADRLYDVAIVGAGPAGLASAVYAASEGLGVLVIDARGFGGQAGASARIENYFGFPTGITGQALTARGYVQAQKFGAEIAIPMRVARLDCGGADGIATLTTDTGRAFRARSVVIASGARYRRPAIPGIEQYEGRGIWYWASPMEAQLCLDQEVVLVGGGNSAGQAAVYLAGHAGRVHMAIRSDGLAATMSRYLIDRIEANPRITLHTRTGVTDLQGTQLGLTGLTLRHRDTGESCAVATRNLFLFIGADPATDWLESCDLARDKAGFVETGFDPALPLASNKAGIFAIGDVRSGSVKRVGGAIGEGAAVVAQIHRYLAARDAGAAG